MSCITSPSGRLGSPFRKLCSFFALSAPWDYRRGFSANALLTRNFGAPPFCFSARSSPRELNRKLSLNPLKTSDWKGRTAGPAVVVAQEADGEAVVEKGLAPGDRVLELNKPAHVWI